MMDSSERLWVSLLISPSGAFSCSVSDFFRSIIQTPKIPFYSLSCSIFRVIAPSPSPAALCCFDRPLQLWLLPGVQPGLRFLSHHPETAQTQTAGSKWYRACLETAEGGVCLLPQSSVLATLGFLLRGFSPRIHGFGSQLLAILGAMDFLL
ncbi:Acyltransferase easC [Fusarium oxysporum f. sp. albedinis]|nr:Acyltransferase easC [Fusarium oxysporum f. sp. albedinis]